MRGWQSGRRGGDVILAAEQRCCGRGTRGGGLPERGERPWQVPAEPRSPGSPRSCSPACPPAPPRRDAGLALDPAGYSCDIAGRLILPAPDLYTEMSLRLPSFYCEMHSYPSPQRGHSLLIWGGGHEAASGGEQMKSNINKNNL